MQRADGHWVFELEADCTIPAEYVLLRHYLGEPDDLELEAKIGRYLRRIQSDRHDGWALFHDGGFDISATVKAYFALKMIGDDPDAPHMARARAAVLARGGALAGNVFTRIQLALYGARPVVGGADGAGRADPRAALVPDPPLAHVLLGAHRGRAAAGALRAEAAGAQPARACGSTSCSPATRSRRSRARPRTPAAAGRSVSPRSTWCSSASARSGPTRLRQRAIDACAQWVGERLNGEDGLGAIYPAMANSVMMYDALGYPPDHPQRAIARQSVENLLVLIPRGARTRSIASPASRRSGTPRSPRTRCSRPAAPKPRRAPTPRSTG